MSSCVNVSPAGPACSFSSVSLKSAANSLRWFTTLVADRSFAVAMSVSFFFVGFFAFFLAGTGFKCQKMNVQKVRALTTSFVLSHQSHHSIITINIKAIIRNLSSFIIHRSSVIIHHHHHHPSSSSSSITIIITIIIIIIHHHHHQHHHQFIKLLNILNLIFELFEILKVQVFFSFKTLDSSQNFKIQVCSSFNFKFSKCSIFTRHSFSTMMLQFQYENKREHVVMVFITIWLRPGLASVHNSSHNTQQPTHTHKQTQINK